MRRRRVLLVLFAFTLSAGIVPLAAAAPPGFKTSQPAAAVKLAPGVKIDPLLTAGDVVGGFQATGVFDGIGFHRSSPTQVELLVDHELANKNIPGRANATDNFDARVTHLSLTNDARVRSGDYVLNGNEGFIWFCSGNLTVLDGTPWFFTGEEDQDQFSPRGGTTIAIDANNRSTYRVLNHFGYFAHEQEMPVTGLDEAAFVLPEDNPGPSNISQLYGYTAGSWSDALDGTGQLGVWVPDGTTFTGGNASTDDIHKGESLTGHFEPLDQTTDNANAAALEQAAQAKGGFDFVRLEDAVRSRTEPGVVYFTDTGRKARETVRGRVYKLAMDPKDPTQATLSVVLDGDAGDPIINPDNLEATGKALVIQEDRNFEHRFPNGVSGSFLQPGESPYSLMQVYDLKKHTLRVVARPNTDSSLFADRGEGDWETSGITDASALYGQGWFFFDTQMHHTTVGQPDSTTLAPNSTTGEGGQLARIHIPGT